MSDPIKLNATCATCDNLLGSIPTAPRKIFRRLVRIVADRLATSPVPASAQAKLTLAAFHGVG